MEMSKLEIEQFEEQLATLYPQLNKQWAWEIQHSFSNHNVIQVTVYFGDPSPSFLMVWSREGNASELDSLDRFIQLVDDEGLSLTDNLQEILDIFCISQNRELLQDVMDLEQMVTLESNLPLLAKYTKMAEDSPTCFFSGEEQQVRFWTADLLRSGDLEEWLFIQRGTKLSIQSWVREKNFFVSLGGLR